MTSTGQYQFLVRGACWLQHLLHWGCLKKQVGIQRSARANVFLENEWRSGGSCETLRCTKSGPRLSSHHPGAGFREWEHAWEDADMPHLKMLSVSFMSVAGQLQISEAIKSEASAVVELHCLAWHSAQVVWQKDWQRLWRTGWQDCHPFRCPWVMSRSKLPGAPSDPKFRRQFATWQV